MAISRHIDVFMITICNIIRRLNVCGTIANLMRNDHNRQKSTERLNMLTKRKKNQIKSESKHI